MTSDDLKQLLQSVATHGTDTVELDEHALVPRIRRRRHRRPSVSPASQARPRSQSALMRYCQAPAPRARWRTAAEAPSRPSERVPSRRTSVG